MLIGVGQDLATEIESRLVFINVATRLIFIVDQVGALKVGR